MFISCWQLTWDDLTSCPAVSADNYNALILHHDSCMETPPFAEKGIEMRGKIVGMLDESVSPQGKFSLGWKHGNEC